MAVPEFARGFFGGALGFGQFAGCAGQIVSAATQCCNYLHGLFSLAFIKAEADQDFYNSISVVHGRVFNGWTTPGPARRRALRSVAGVVLKVI
jgi:hypothetical protein